MATVRNDHDYREMILEALGLEGDFDVENDSNFRGAILTALNIDFVPADLQNFEIYRTLLLAGITGLVEAATASDDDGEGEIS